MKSNRPNVVGAHKAVTPPTLKWSGSPAPPNAADEYARVEIIKEGARRATATGGSVIGRAHEVANELGKQLEPGRGIQ